MKKKYLNHRKSRRNDALLFAHLRGGSVSAAAGVVLGSIAIGANVVERPVNVQYYQPVALVPDDIVNFANVPGGDDVDDGDTNYPIHNAAAKRRQRLHQYSNTDSCLFQFPSLVIFISLFFFIHSN